MSNVSFPLFRTLPLSRQLYDEAFFSRMAICLEFVGTVSEFWDIRKLENIENFPKFLEIFQNHLAIPIFFSINDFLSH